MLRRVEKKEINLLEKLLQLYLHDLSNSFKIDFDSDKCEYIYEDLNKYFIDDNFKPYFIVFDNKIVGFILYKFIEINIVQEIFILNNYKKMNSAYENVIELFNMYKGTWDVKCVPNSEVAEKFWNKVINEYTKGNFMLEHTGKYNRAEFSFNNEEL